ncbi:threonine synthase [Pikeienuella piscinae]|uniref:Threonine synthase n=1 Tax=Pikeienuella piscinae TaxID=2748098 RepID=A0A7M3T5C9_9RHOB|nr:threonine synthase [Pikeienuella piscinae]QIE57210.1 threonine synthase [Pikeienuella piscinae]
MRYTSTRGGGAPLHFEDAMLAGLARDGGLFVPESWPRMNADEIAGLAGLAYEEIAFRVMRPFIGGAFADDAFRVLIERAYAGFDHRLRAPLLQVGEETWALELHHGPTLAFKDVAMQLIGQMFEAALTRRGARVTIVGATSGDTGSAAIEAFRGMEAADIFILYPHGRVSEVQRRQMTTPAEANVHAIAVEGDFDDCQAAVKAMFNDHAFRDKMRLAAVNSINWARVLAQSVYYFTAAVALGAPSRPISFAVPTGNFGDIYAGYVAKRMGLPIDRLIIATNRNDILHRTVQTGAHEKRGVAPTTSPSMDIQVSSNFERLLFDLHDREGEAVARLMRDLTGNQGGFTLSQGALDRLRAEFDSARFDEDEVAALIGRFAAETGHLFCPHSAIGLGAAIAHSGPTVGLATAHAAKFPDAVEAATGRRPALPEHMADLYEREERITVAPADTDFLKRLIVEKARA